MIKTHTYKDMAVSHLFRWREPWWEGPPHTKFRLYI